jgi:hypothetical protein
MSEHVWCHGPSCHEQHTQDRIRGTSGSKVLRTSKVQFNPEYINMYSYFCSNGCYNDFANKYIQQVIAIAPRPSHLKHRLIEWRKLNMKTIIAQTKQDERTEERKNRFTGESIMLTPAEAIKHDEYS